MIKGTQGKLVFLTVQFKFRNTYTTPNRCYNVTINLMKLFLIKLLNFPKSTVHNTNSCFNKNRSGSTGSICPYLFHRQKTHQFNLLTE